MLAGFLTACSAELPQEVEEPVPYGTWADPLEWMPRGAAQLETLCERSGDDPVRALFCGESPPQITSMVDLQVALGLQSDAIAGIRGLSVTGHSTALGARSISTINPRVIVLQLEPPPSIVVPPPYPELLSLGFARGEQFVELITRDRLDKELRFYVLAFRQACNETPRGCTPGDLLTPAIEGDWLETSLYDDRDLVNTVLDCNTCHQPDGPGTPKILRMQELDPPWTHWFSTGSEGGRALIADYVAAKGDEPLAGMTGAQIALANPISLNMQVIYGGGVIQPNEFDSLTIEAEVRESAAAMGGAQPEDNSIAGESATWLEGYRRSLRGEAIAFPYHNVKVSDADKLAEMTEVYQAYRRGEIEASALPDIRDVFPDDPLRLAQMGFTTEPGLSGEEVLLQACSTCHNPRLDQSLSRARFRADLEGVSRAVRDNAIARLKLPPDNPLAMPPPRLRTLTEEARARAIEVLGRRTD